MGKVAPTDCEESAVPSTSPRSSPTATSSSEATSGPTSSPLGPSTRSQALTPTDPAGSSPMGSLTSKPAPTASTSCPSPPVDQDTPTTHDSGGLNLAWVLALGGLVMVVALVAVLVALSRRSRSHERSETPPPSEPLPAQPPPFQPPPSELISPVLDYGAIEELVRAWDRTTDPAHAAAVEADLALLGVTRVRARRGEVLNPSLHRVVDVTDEPGAVPGTLIDEVRPGWTAGNEVIRPADVRVRGEGTSTAD